MDGQPFTGQQHINGKAVRLVRKGRTLEVQLDGRTVAVVEDFYAAPTEGGQANTAQLVGVDPLALDLPDTLSAQPLQAELSPAQLQQATTLTYAQPTNPLHGTQWAQAAIDTKTDASASDTKTDGRAPDFNPVNLLDLISTLALVGAGLWGNISNRTDVDRTGNISNRTDVDRTVTGQFMAGPLVSGHGLKVQLFQADGTTTLGEPVGLTAQGQFTAVVKNYTGVVIAKIILDSDASPDYLDEALGTGKDLNTVLMVAGELTAGSTSITLNINPLTTVAVVKMGANPTAAKVADTNTQVATAFGLTDPAGLTGINVVPAVSGSTYDSADGLTQGELYGAILAAMSGKDRENSGNSQTTIDQIAAGVSGTTLSPSAQAILVQGATSADTQVAGDLRTALAKQLAPIDALPADISNVQVTDLTPLRMAQLSSAQLATLTTAQVAQLTANQIDALSPAQIAALGTDLSSLSTAAMASIDPSQAAGITSTQLDSFDTADIAALAPAAVGGL
ncbi:hypothetical protein, partial [uncultured Limnohabitans sp.]|uniref:hypothetical protein n=1 Tax=uncultured Limnohabitans sp. TaxID=768543 RepID=UPI002603765E